jgi:hypothetical protein
MVIMSPIILLFFLVFPRWDGAMFPGFGFNQAATQNRTGLTDDLKLSKQENLEMDDSLAFRALMKKQNFLPYWRSHTLSKTDGWNWEHESLEQLPVSATKKEFSGELNVVQFIFPLPTKYIISPFPYLNLESRGVVYERNTSSDSAFWPYGHYPREYKVVAKNELQWSEKPSIQDRQLEPKTLSTFKDIGAKEIKSQELHKTILTMANFFKSAKFSYQLRTSAMNSVDVFLKNKTGNCGHYASTVALWFRGLGFHSRVVMGYVGGEYVEAGQYYIIRQSDAHAWVEVWNTKKLFWQKIDPILWISPIIQDRMDNYHSFSKRVLPSFLYPYYLKTWGKIDQWGASLFLQFLNYNKQSQRKLSHEFHLTQGEFYTLGGALIILFLLYQYYFQGKRAVFFSGRSHLTPLARWFILRNQLQNKESINTFKRKWIYNRVLKLEKLLFREGMK